MTDRRPPKKTESIEVRIAPETKKAFMASCAKRRQSASAVIRQFITAYIADTGRAPGNQPRTESFMTKILSNKKTSLAALAACAAGAAIVTPSAAADPRLEAVFIWLDEDHDNAISKAEFLTPGKSGDPVFNGIEIVIGTKGAIPKDETRAELFDRIDISGDGRISLKEFDRISIVDTIVREPILRADQDGDGEVTEGELVAHIVAARAKAGDTDPAAGAALMARGVINAHDSDNDGAVSELDFAG